VTSDDAAAIRTSQEFGMDIHHKASAQAQQAK
jgi:hypothetical protein